MAEGIVVVERGELQVADPDPDTRSGTRIDPEPVTSAAEDAVVDQEADEDLGSVVAVVVPHTHWDREWYAPFEAMRFHLVHMLDELVETLEHDPELSTFLLDGQVVILEDYLEVRRDQRDRVAALVAAGRLRPGPFYVQPDEFHLSGEALVRNLLVGIATSREFGWVMREGYLPDTFGHVHQLPQILRGFGIETFYAMRGFGAEVAQTGSQFWWAAPDGSRVRVEWLTESYSNAAILTGDPATMALRHGVLVAYDSLPELLHRMSARSPSQVLLLLNGGDHLRVQADVPGLVRGLDAGVAADVRLGGLEEFHALVAARSSPERVVRGELRSGARHDVFDGIGSTRTPLKRLHEQTEAHLTGVAERLDAWATLVDGRSGADSLRYAWRELLKNYAHDSICGCSVDAVHEEMVLRFTKVGQVARAVAEDALGRLAAAVPATPAGTVPSPAGAAPPPAGTVPVVVVNPSAFARTGPVAVDVVFDLTAPVGQRQFGWVQQPGGSAADYRLLDAEGRAIPFRAVAGTEVVVADALNRRKELLRDRIRFTAPEVPALGMAVYRLMPTTEHEAEHAAEPELGPVTARGATWLENDRLRVEVAPDGRLTVISATGRRFDGLLELLDDGDAGDEYGFGPLPDDQPLSSREGTCSIDPGPDPASLSVRTVLGVPRGLTSDRRARAAGRVDLPVTAVVRLRPAADRVEVDLTVDNRARDHRLRIRFPSSTGAATSRAESAYGIVRRDRQRPDGEGWQEHPSGAHPLRRFVAVEDEGAGLQILTEGLYEYHCPTDGVVDVTLLRGVGWLANLDHPRRGHKVGPQIATPGAQCLGEHTFRLGIRPYVPGRPGALYRAAEEFSVPLQGWAVQGRPSQGRPVPGRPAQGRAVQGRAVQGRPDQGPGAPSGADRSPPFGLAVTPEDVVVSAVKTAEDRDGVVIRVFNCSDDACTASLRPRFAVAAAHRCDLEEIALRSLPVAADGSVRLPLEAGQIATVRLRPSPPPSTETSRP